MSYESDKEAEEEEAMERELLKSHPEWTQKPFFRDPKKRDLPLIKILEDMEVDWESEEPITEDHIINKIGRLAFLPWAKTLHLPAVRKDQIHCLELIGKYLKMFNDRPKDDSGYEDMQKKMKSAMARLRKSNDGATD
jgi:hypothetical protein